MRWVVKIGFFAVACWGVFPAAYGQFLGQRFIAPMETQITPEIDRNVELAIREARQLIEQKQFLPAVERLQAVLDHSEDYFLAKDFETRSSSPTTPPKASNPIGPVRQPRVVPGPVPPVPNIPPEPDVPTAPSGPMATTEGSIRAQVLRILAELPPDGRNVYETEFGPRARDLLKQATARNDFAAMSQLVRRYPMTTAGFQALQMLAARAFDREQPLRAALLSETLLNHPQASGPLKGPLLLQTAYAWHLAGEREKSLVALEALGAEKGPLKIGGQAVDPRPENFDSPEWLKAHFGRPVEQSLQIVEAWEMPRGGVTGSESATVTCPVGGGQWSVSPREYLRLLSDPVANGEQIKAFDDLTSQVERAMRENNRLSQPAWMPLVVGDVVVYRTLNDITAVSLKTGKLLWRSSTTDGMMAWLFQSTKAHTDNLSSTSLLTFRGYLRFKMYRDQLSGSLTSDGTLVYAIEEAESQFSPLLNRGRMPFGAQIVTDPANKLVAYELKGGRLLWEVGGVSGTPPAELSSYFFLGAPVPLEGRLYCLAESKSEIRLLSLIPGEKGPRLDWSQALVTSDRGYFVAPRRLAGLVPVIDEGLAVCPTANGSIVAFDLVQRQLRWGYSYDSFIRRNLQGGDFPTDEEEGRWLDSNPILVDGRVITTPRDSSDLLCLNLADGKLIWKRAREQGLYVAGVIDGRVIVVGRSQITAYSLADGSEAWKEPVEIPEPAGRGVRIEAQYLLPLSTGEIATMDLATGRILGRSRLPEGRSPGNLVVGSGSLVSSGIHDVIGFRSMADVEQQIRQQLAVNPVDPEALALRGELKLHRGLESEAIADLRQSLKQKPTPQVKQLLAETILNRLKGDPKELMKSAEELSDLAEAPRVNAEFRRLYASALNDAGDRVGAVTQLLRLAIGSPIPDEMFSIEPGRMISLEQSIRSQLFQIYENADAGQQERIRRVVGIERDAAIAAPDGKLRVSRLIKLLVGHPAAERHLLGLAENRDALPDELSRVRLLERLSQSGIRSIAAEATASMAAALLAADSNDAAVPWILDLKTRYSQEVCRGGKTGRQWADEWLARADVKIPVTSDPWPTGEFRVKRTEESTLLATFPVEVVTRESHYFQGWTFETDSLVTTLTARDSSSRVAWRLPLPNNNEELRGQSGQIHICGRRLAFSVGTWLRVMEVKSLYTPPDVLFDKSLRPHSPTMSRRMENRAERRLLANGREFPLQSDGRGTPGFLLGLSDEALCFQLDNRLYAADPETGQLLWSWTGSQFAKVEGTVGREIVVNTSSNGALILRTLDGTVRETVSGNPQDMPVWFRGTGRLSHRAPTSDQRLFEFRDFDGDQVVWQSQHPAGTLHCIVDDEEVALLEPSGNFLVLDLHTGEKRLTVELPAKRPTKLSGHLAVQRSADQYVVAAGVSSRNTDQRRIVPLNNGPPREFGLPREFGPTSTSSFTLDGFVCGVNRPDEKLKWSVPVTDLAYDTSQPTNLPVMVLASYQSEIDKFAGLAMTPPRLSVLVLDKRTGRKLYEKQEPVGMIGRGVQFTPLIDERKVIIDFYNWQLDLTIPPQK